MWTFLTIIFVLCGLARIHGATASAKETFKHPLTDMPPSAEDVTTSYFFPAHTDLKMPAGEVVTALCHFANSGSGYYNISGQYTSP